MSRNKKVTGLTSPISFKTRRTSLNVNLSYVSSTSLLTEDVDEANTPLSTCYESVDNSLEKTIISKTNLPIRRNLSLKGSNLSNKIVKSNSSNSTRHINDTLKIKPSFVKMVRLRTSTYLTSGNENLLKEQISEETFPSSENLKRSSVLEEVRFPLVGEIFSPNVSVVMETSMDLTEVQNAAVFNLDPVVTETLDVSSGVDRENESSLVVQDTEDVSCERIEERMEPVIIPDSEQDSINTIRTSLNVNTSLDSRFSSAPNSSLYDPRKSEDSQFEQDIPMKKLNAALSHSISETLDGIAPVNPIIVETAVMEHGDKSGHTNYEEIQDQEATIRLEPHKKFYSSHNTPVKSRNDEPHHKESPPNENGTIVSPSLMHQDAEREQFRIDNYEDDIIRSVVPGGADVAKNPIRRGKKKLMSLRRSEMVEVSPVSVEMAPGKGTVPKKRGRKCNKTAKKIKRKENDVTKRLVYISDDDIMEVENVPKKEKRVRKVKMKKIVIKKKADVDLWKRLNGIVDITNESCDDISSALGRTSLNDFEPKNNLSKHKSRKIRPKIIIVATGLPMEQKLLVKSTVAALGSAKLEKVVTRNTTHVVGRGLRTVNLLRGLVRGCWLVSFEWILKSCEAKEWVDPEKYEITSFSKAVQENRKEKQLFGAAYVSELFLTCGLIHINEETSTPASVLKELVRIAGGRVATNPEEANIVIGRGGFKEIWILDSITNGVIQPLNQYSRKKCLN